MTPAERRQALEEIAAEVATCTRCPLSATRTMAVPGEGHPDTEVVFIGEGPGYNEDQQGRPFVGAAGGLLNELLKAIGWKREEVFITNVVKCRPPANRDPEPTEIAACRPYLRRQLEVLDPAVVVTLGRHSLGTFMPGARISGAHGTQRPTNPDTGARSALTYAMYHPAAALRQHSLRQTMLADMAGLPEALLDSRSRRVSALQAPPADMADGQPHAPLDEPPAVAVPVTPDRDRDQPQVEAVLAATAPLAADDAADDSQLGLFG